MEISTATFFAISVLLGLSLYSLTGALVLWGLGKLLKFQNQNFGKSWVAVVVSILAIGIAESLLGLLRLPAPAMLAMVVGFFVFYYLGKKFHALSWQKIVLAFLLTWIITSIGLGWGLTYSKKFIEPVRQGERIFLRLNL